MSPESFSMNTPPEESPSSMRIPSPEDLQATLAAHPEGIKTEIPTLDDADVMDADADADAPSSLKIPSAEDIRETMESRDKAA